MCLKTTSMRIYSVIFLGAKVNHQYVVPYILLYFLFENQSDVSFHQTAEVTSFFIILWSKSVIIIAKSYQFLYYSKEII